MARKKANNQAINKLEAEQRKQSRIIAGFKRRNRLFVWLGAAVVVLLLFSIFTMGYASNWWQDPIRTSQFAQDGSDGGSLANEGTSDDTRSTVTSRNGGGSNSSSNSRDTTTTNNNTTRETSNSKTETNNTKTTENTSSDSSNTDIDSSDVPSSLQILLDEIDTGDNIDGILARADELGIEPDCHTVLLVVQECTFNVGGHTITTKNLITDDSITGITSNF